MKLIVAEKPSVARSIAAVIGADKKQTGCLEGGGYLVSWCLGHLVELASADRYNAAYAKWRGEDLPILPQPWQYNVREATQSQFETLKRLMNDPRVESVICATDAGREGELIFRTIYQETGCHKPVERLWISSMEDEAIREGFEQLKPASEYDALYQAALCRAKADWLVGINATRLFSTLYGVTLNIGRVMTPTLGMLAAREAQIAAFQPAPFYTVSLDCGSFTAVSERYSERQEAERVAALCNGREAKITALETKERAEKPPLLYDLTSLQRDANRLLGYTAQQTLDYTQSLYEKQLCTYPRTDSRYLPDDMRQKISDLAGSAARTLPFIVPDEVLCNPAQVIDGSKVSDHHALLPTMHVDRGVLDDLPAGEKALLTLLMTRLLCAVADPCRVLEPCVSLDCEGVSFAAKGQQTVNKGWKALDEAYLSTLKNSQEQRESPNRLPVLNERMTFLPVTAAVREGMTTPPKHYTEDTLLSAMETAGADETPKDAERKGLGTPATRAGIIEKLIQTGQVERRKKKQSTVLVPTDKGMSLITVVPEALQSPTLTAEWEQKLKQVERGGMEADAFLCEITEMVRNLVATVQPVKGAQTLFGDSRKAVGTCPRCGSPVMENRKGFCCVEKTCGFALWKNDRFFLSKRRELTAKEAAALLKEGRVFMRNLYSEKTGKTYDASVVLDDPGQGYVRFKLEFEREAKK